MKKLAHIILSFVSIATCNLCSMYGGFYGSKEGVGSYEHAKAIMEAEEAQQFREVIERLEREEREEARLQRIQQEQRQRIIQDMRYERDRRGRD